MLRLKVWVPDDLWNTVQDFGQRHHAAQVAAYWEPCGDGLCLEDPNGGALCGLGDASAWFEFMQLQNRAFLSEYNPKPDEKQTTVCLTAIRVVYLWRSRTAEMSITCSQTNASRLNIGTQDFAS